MATKFRHNSREQQNMWRFAVSLRFVKRYEKENGEPSPHDPRLVPGRVPHEYADKTERRYFREKRFIASYEGQHPGAIERQIDLDQVRANHHRLAGVEVR